MKYVLFLLALCSFQVFAQQDSVAVFYRPERVVILINERFEQGNRLNDFLDHIRAGESYDFITTDKTINISCYRGTKGSSCTFKFIPGKDILIENRSVKVSTDLATLNLENTLPYNLHFRGSMNDKFDLKILEDGKVEIFAAKPFGKN